MKLFDIKHFLLFLGHFADEMRVALRDVNININIIINILTLISQYPFIRKVHINNHILKLYIYIHKCDSEMINFFFIIIIDEVKNYVRNNCFAFSLLSKTE